jgi:hypothetical protein
MREDPNLPIGKVAPVFTELIVTHPMENPYIIEAPCQQR